MTDTLIVRSLTVRPVNAPLAEPVRTASGDILTAPLVLLDLQTEEGVVGRSYLRCISQDVLEPLAQLTATMGAVLESRRGRPEDLSDFLRSRYRLLGLGGLVGMAIGGIDMAAWDAAARSRDASLLHLLGAEPVPVDAYASFGMLDPATAAARSGAAVDLGYRGIKVKLGFPDVAQDEAVLRAIRDTVGGVVALMVDYNQSLTVAEAIARIQRLAEFDLLWVEEPVLAEDFDGHARIARAVDTGLQIGENWMGAADMAKSVAAGASRYAMFDAMKIGGITGWRAAARLAETHDMPVSSHAFPEISGQLLAATPGRHWLEYLDTANPILREPARIVGGRFVFPDLPGTGLDWDEDAVRRYAI